VGVTAIPPPRPLVLWHPAATPPDGYIKANGATISRTAYAWLFQQIGTTFGAGDGSTTFKIPDLRGEFLRGLDDGRGVDASRVLGTFQDHAIQAHTHPESSVGSSPYAQSGYEYGAAGAGGTTGNNSGNSASETRPRNIAGLYCIAYAP